MKSYLRMIGLFVLLIVIHQGLQLIYLVSVSTYYQVIGIEANQLTEMIYAQSINAIIFSGIGALIIFYLIFKNKTENLLIRSRFYPISRIQVIWSSIIGFSFVFLSQLIVQGLSKVFPTQYVKFIETMNLLIDAPFLGVFIAVVILAPLFEEVMFRGIVFDSLSKRMNVYIAVIIAGLFFGIYHFNIFQGAYASIIGIVMGLSLVWTKSIWAPIIIHFVNNLLSIVFSYTVIGSYLDLDQTLPLLLSIAISITILPFGIYKLYLSRKMPNPEEPIEDQSNLEPELDAIV